jgi:hypothetical protein
MSIRIRQSNGMTIALCAAETDEAPGDLLIDDAQHYALAAKFAQDGAVGEFPREWAEMERHKLRDAEMILNDWLATSRSQHEGAE